MGNGANLRISWQKSRGIVDKWTSFQVDIISSRHRFKLLSSRIRSLMGLCWRLTGCVGGGFCGLIDFFCVCFGGNCWAWGLVFSFWCAVPVTTRGECAKTQTLWLFCGQLLQWMRGVQCFVEPINLTNGSCSLIGYLIRSDYGSWWIGNFCYYNRSVWLPEASKPESTVLMMILLHCSWYYPTFVQFCDNKLL
jgi:hypothetical protein